MSPRRRPPNLRISTGLRTASSLTWSSGRPGPETAAATSAGPVAATFAVGAAAASAGAASSRAKVVNPKARIIPSIDFPAARARPKSQPPHPLSCRLLAKQALAVFDGSPVRCDEAWAGAGAGAGGAAQLRPLGALVAAAGAGDDVLP